MMGCFGQRWVAAGPSRISESSKLWEVAINVSVDEAGSPGWSTHQNPQDYVNHGGQKGVGYFRQNPTTKKGTLEVWPTKKQQKAR
jgi:hypothetical protein